MINDPETPDRTKRELLLLGAGASVGAGMPTATSMTEVMVRDLLDHRDLVAFILGQLQAAKGTQGVAPVGATHGIDVEQFVNAVTLLEERDSLELSPFVGAWNPRLVELDHSVDSFSSRIAVRDLFEKLLAGLQVAETRSSRHGKFPITGNSFLDSEFAHAVKSVLGLTGRGRALAELREAMLQVVLRSTRIKNPESVNYLRPLLDLHKAQKGRLVIATLNYDDAIEALASKERVPLDDAIDSWHPRGDLGPPDDGTGIFLLKLHGSVTWCLKGHECVHEAPSQKRLRPAIIFGGRNKLTVEGPFLDLLLAFRRELARSTSVTALGYSFRDEHVSGYVERWLSQTPENRLRIVDPDLQTTIQAAPEKVPHKSWKSW